MDQRTAEKDRRDDAPTGGQFVRLEAERTAARL
jgi:hypothetical protein